MNSNDFRFFIKKNKMNFKRPTITFFSVITVGLFLNSCSGTSACECKANDLKGAALDTEIEEKCKAAENEMSVEEKEAYISEYKDCK